MNTISSPVSEIYMNSNRSSVLQSRASNKVTGKPSSIKGNTPIIPIDNVTHSKYQMTLQEKSIRCKVAAIYRLVELHQWTHGIFNHISVRLSDSDNIFLLNPFGLLYHEVSAASLIKVDFEGNVIEKGSTSLGINKAGWLLHSTLHEFRHDICCVLHIHLPEIIAVSSMKCGLLPCSVEAQQLLMPVKNENGDFHSMICYHDYNGIFVNVEEKQSLKDDLGPYACVMFLRNHGVAICSSSIEQTWLLTRLVVSACKAQTKMINSRGLASVQKLFSINETVSDTRGNVDSAFLMHTSSNNPILNVHVAQLEFEAMMRLLDNKGFRTGYSYTRPLLIRSSTLTRTTSGLSDFIMTSSGQYRFKDDGPEDGDVKGRGKEIKDQITENKAKSEQRRKYLMNDNHPSETIMVPDSKHITFHDDDDDKKGVDQNNTTNQVTLTSQSDTDADGHLQKTKSHKRFKIKLLPSFLRKKGSKT